MHSSPTKIFAPTFCRCTSYFHIMLCTTPKKFCIAKRFPCTPHFHLIYALWNLLLNFCNRKIFQYTSCLHWSLHIMKFGRHLNYFSLILFAKIYEVPSLKNSLKWYLHQQSIRKESQCKRNQWVCWLVYLSLHFFFIIVQSTYEIVKQLSLEAKSIKRKMIRKPTKHTWRTVGETISKPVRKT